MFSFFFDRSDGLIRKLSGYKARKPSEDRKRYASSRQGLPSRVDLRNHMTAVEDQGDTNSCVANAVAGAYEYLIKRHWGEDGYDVSRLFIYYNARVIDDDGIEDEGSVIEHAIDSLTTYGACAEACWPFDEDAINEEPDEDAYEEAAGFLIEDVSVVPTELDAWRRCLADGYPIIFGLQLYHSFDNHRRRGLVPVPTRREASREDHGGHAMLCVGYSDRDQVFIVRNSWGSDWGDSGYCYIPYRYIINDKYNDGDTWVIRQIEALEDDDETWGDDDESMLVEVSTVLAQLDDADYEALLDAMGEVPIESRIALLMLWGQTPTMTSATTSWTPSRTTWMSCSMRSASIASPSASSRKHASSCTTRSSSRRASSSSASTSLRRRWLRSPPISSSSAMLTS
jgi:hypothetical protein